MSNLQVKPHQPSAPSGNPTTSSDLLSSISPSYTPDPRRFVTQIFSQRWTDPPDMAPSEIGSSLKRNHDALIEAGYPPHLEDTKETQAGTGTDTRKSKRIKLSAVGINSRVVLCAHFLLDLPFTVARSRGFGSFITETNILDRHQMF